MSKLSTVSMIRNEFLRGVITAESAMAALSNVGYIAVINDGNEADMNAARCEFMSIIAHIVRSWDGRNQETMLPWELPAALRELYREGTLPLSKCEEIAERHHMSVMLDDMTLIPREPYGPPEPMECPNCEATFLQGADDAVECGDDVYCCEDCAHEAGWERCERCDDWVHVGDGVEIYDGCIVHRYCDGGCANNDGWLRCDRCGDWTHEDNSHRVNCGGEWETWCDDCECDDARRCYGCGNLFHHEEVTYDENDDEYYCDRCAPRDLHEYGYTPYLNFYGDAKKSPYLGYELETDGGNDRNAYVRQLAAIEGFCEHFYMTKDSSLRNGVEITSHPMTLAYAVSIGPTMEKIREVALANGFQSHNGGRCGLHVHVNRDFFGKSEDAQDLGGYKMMRLLQRHESKFLKFARRRDAYWCSFQTDDDYEPDNPEEVEPTTVVMDKAKRMKHETNHAQALNFQHSATFEIRIFRGTLNLSTFYACLAMANGLAHVAKEHSAYYVENVEWTKLMGDVVSSCDEPTSARYLREYLEEHELL